jgi:hypothetical protein
VSSGMKFTSSIVSVATFMALNSSIEAAEK